MIFGQRIGGFLLGLDKLVFFVDFVELFNHLVKFVKILGVILAPALIGLDLAHLEDSLGQICIWHKLLLSAKILDKTYGLIFRIFRVLFFSPWNLLILRRQRRIVE